MSELRIKRRAHPGLAKRAKRGFRGYPVATIAFYGPDDRRASKVGVGIVFGENQEAAALERWFSEDGDVRFDPSVGEAIGELIQRHGVQSVAMADRIIGCPHEEGIDYPEGEVRSALSAPSGQRGTDGPERSFTERAEHAACDRGRVRPFSWRGVRAKVWAWEPR